MGSDGKESASNDEGPHPTPVSLPGEFQGQRNLVVYSP